MKYAGQKLNAARTERAVKRLKKAAARPKGLPKKVTKLDRLVLAKKQSMAKTKWKVGQFDEGIPCELD